MGARKDSIKQCLIGKQCEDDEQGSGNDTGRSLPHL